MRLSVWLGALLVFVVAVGGTRAQVKLEWNLKGGDKFWLETSSNSKQTMKTVGRELKQDVEQTTIFAVNVLSVAEDKTTVLEQKLESLIFRTGGPMGPVNDTFSQQLAGLTFKMTISPKGEITIAEYDKVIAKIAGDDPNAQKAVKQVLTEAALTQAAADAFLMLPEKPVKTADTWERKLTKPLGPMGSLELVRKFSYDGQETVGGKPLEKITFSTASSTYTPPKAGEPTPFLFQVVKGEMKVDEFRGSAQFDAQAGRLVKSEWTMKLKGVVTVSVSGTNIETEAVQEMTVKTRVLDKEPEKPGGAPAGAEPANP